MGNKYNGYKRTRRRGVEYVNGVSLFHIYNRPGIAVPKECRKFDGSVLDWYFNEIYPKEHGKKN